MNENLVFFYGSIVLVYSYLLYNIPNKNVVQMVILTILTALIIYCGQKMILSEGKVKHSKNSKYHNNVQNLKVSGGRKKTADLVEKFTDFSKTYEYVNTNIKKEMNKKPMAMKEIVSGGLMGPYDGKCIKEPKDTYSLLESTGFVPQGSQGPLKDRISDDSYLTGPHLDGTPDTSESLFMFANNKCSPSCCPSTYSCDGGCVCTTENQRKLIDHGGVI
jgi:hypothetical protein